MIDFLSSSILGGYVFNKFTDGMEHLKTSLKEKMMSDAEIETIKAVLEGATEQDLKNEESIKNFLESKLDKSKFDPVIKMRFNKPLNFIGREEDLKNLRESLEQDNKAVLVNGLGGVGKSTLAKEFYCESLGEYENAIWLDFGESIENTVFTFPHLEKLTQEKIEDPKRAFEKFKYALGELTGKNLLILDNVNNPKDLKQCKNIFPPNWTVLITSRATVTEGFNKVDLDVLEVEKARELFYSYYRGENNDDLVDKILEKIYRHTLLIELLAKTGNIGSVPLDELLENVEKYGYQISKEIEIDVESEHSKEQAELIHVYIEKIFDTTDLNEEEIHLLTNFTVLPSIHIDLDFFIELYGEKKYKVINTLHKLCEKGWIQKIDEKSYFLHQTLQEVLKEKLKPTVESCKNVVDNVIDLTDYTAHKNMLDYFQYLTYCYALLENIENHLFLEISKIYWNIAYILKETGNLNQALENALKDLKIKEELNLDKNNESLSRTFVNLSGIYKSKGVLEKALEYQQKSIKIFQEIYDTENHPNLATAYGNLAVIYKDKGDLEKALEYQQKTIEIFQEIYDIVNHPHLATTYGNLANIYRDKGELEKALEYQKKSIEICEEIYDTENHPNLMIAYWVLGTIYYELNNINEAKKFIEKAYKIYQFNFPNGHPVYKGLDGWYKDVCC